MRILSHEREASALSALLDLRRGAEGDAVGRFARTWTRPVSCVRAICSRSALLTPIRWAVSATLMPDSVQGTSVTRLFGTGLALGTATWEDSSTALLDNSQHTGARPICRRRGVSNVLTTTRNGCRLILIQYYRVPLKIAERIEM